MIPTRDLLGRGNNCLLDPREKHHPVPIYQYKDPNLQHPDTPQGDTQTHADGVVVRDHVQQRQTLKQNAPSARAVDEETMALSTRLLALATALLVLNQQLMRDLVQQGPYCGRQDLMLMVMEDLDHR